MSSSNGDRVDSPNTLSESAVLRAILELRAEQREVVGRLWQRVDEAKVEAAENSKKVQEKLDTWTETNRLLLASNQELIKIIVMNSQEMRKSAEFSAKESDLLRNLAQQLQRFEQATNAANLTSTALIAASSLQPLIQEISSLRAAMQALEKTADPSLVKVQLSDLKTALRKLAQSIDQKTDLAQPTGAIASDRRLILGGSFGLGLVLVLGLLALKLDSNYLIDHVNQVIWKLQAIEKQLP